MHVIAKADGIPSLDNKCQPLILAKEVGANKMIMIDNWIVKLTDKLKATFGDRLIFVGLQGSYQRGEANENSDIDAVIILNELSLDDLKQYKDILATMPENNKACGFISGKREIQNWTKHELFQFTHDTRPCYGSLDGMLPQIGREDVIESVKTGVSSLYHVCCHTYIHGELQLSGMYKGAFFILQAVYYLRNGKYIGSKKELLPLLTGLEREILTIGMNWNDYQEKVFANPDKYFDTIIRWCSDVLDEAF